MSNKKQFVLMPFINNKLCIDYRGNNYCVVKKVEVKELGFKNRKDWYHNYYLRTYWWNVVKRDEVLKYFYSRCVLCGNDKLLQVHHNNYDNFWQETSGRDLSLLCRTHHSYFHKKYRIGDKYDSDLIDCNVSSDFSTDYTRLGIIRKKEEVKELHRVVTNMENIVDVAVGIKGK